MKKIDLKKIKPGTYMTVVKKAPPAASLVGKINNVEGAVSLQTEHSPNNTAHVYKFQTYCHPFVIMNHLRCDAVESSRTFHADNYEFIFINRDFVVAYFDGKEPMPPRTRLGRALSFGANAYGAHPGRYEV